MFRKEITLEEVIIKFNDYSIENKKGWYSDDTLGIIETEVVSLIISLELVTELYNDMVKEGEEPCLTCLFYQAIEWELDDAKKEIFGEDDE